ncbi:hypothetical protein FHY05_001383 [Sphingomonas sp. BK580]|nr:hypothetical protein [Sphingomonas sp. BK580]
MEERSCPASSRRGAPARAARPLRAAALPAFVAHPG